MPGVRHGIIGGDRVYYFRLIVDSRRDVVRVLFVEPTDTSRPKCR